MDKTERYLIFDESGNLGKSGRYFIISCIDTTAPKALHNLMKRKIKQAKNTFPDLAGLHSNEIKANEAYPCVRHHILESIISKDISISYIVADLNYIEQHLLVDKNLLYNFLSKILIENLVSEKDEGSTLHILFDNKATKTFSKNSLQELIKIGLLYEKELKLNINFEYRDSNAKNAFVIQAADYVANALYSYYEYGNALYSTVIQPKVNIVRFYP